MAFIGILVYMFFFFIRLQDWWPPLLGFPVADVLMPLILICLFPSLSRLYNICKLPQSIFLFFFVIAVFLSNLINGHTEASFEYGMTFLKFMVIFIIILASVNTFLKLKWSVIFIIALVAFIAYQGVVQAQTGFNCAGVSPHPESGRMRWVGAFDGANITALIFVMVIPFLLEFFVSWGISYKIFSVLAGFMVLTGFYLTNSRGGFISLLAVILGFVLTKIKNSKKGIIIGLVLVTCLMIFAAPSRMNEIDDSEKSSRGRINAWGESLEMIRYHNPILGVGKGQFTRYTTYIAHNAVLQQLGETGLLGFFFWSGFIYITVTRIYKILMKKEIDPQKLSFYKAFFISFTGFFIGLFFISADFEIFYIWVALLTSIIIIEKIDLRISLKDIKIIGAIELSAIMTTYIVVNTFKRLFF